ncbi:metal transporter [Croceibacterium mercuriale]|uniref:Metal transporter n=1 Tax=Croceibacterium mercuriale TaxID=1572751 RepID=A0A0B2BZB1_9SPHN|nr:TolC family protein [Croceibacterium mercuriale]KHL25362.1 metal transporter [Croceibacterium mercuriale]
MTSLDLRGALLGGLALATWSAPAASQSNDILTLGEALELSGAATIGEQAFNPRLVGPQEEVTAAEAEISQAGLRPNPVVSLEVENVAGTGAFSGAQATEFTLAASLPIERGGKRQARVNAAEADLAVAGLRSELAGAELGQAVRERYVIAVAAQARVELAENVLERNRELARIAQALVDAGREPPLRALRAQSELAQAEAQLKVAQAEALAARLGLGALWAPQSTPEVPATFPDIDPPDALLASYAGIELRLAAAEREALQADVALQRSLGVPDPTVSAGIRRLQQTSDQAFLVGVSIPLPLRNRNQGNIAAAEARARAASARESVVQADYRQEVAQARADFLAAEARADTLESGSLPQAEEALRLAQIGYRNGRFPQLEVLSAAEARDTIRRFLIDAREAQGRAAARLIRLAAQ